MGEYTATDIAKYIIGQCPKIANLKLQKMLYFVWCDYYKATHKVLFDDEIQAWMYGPVVPNVYYRYRRFVAMPIIEKDRFEPSLSDRNVLDRSIGKYRDQNHRQLISRSHVEGGPWAQAYDPALRNTVIPFKSIMDYCNT
ncbi:MAG: SocA family protein, partial [archaeon]|nr:SocA family protein [archaeon]